MDHSGLLAGVSLGVGLLEVLDGAHAVDLQSPGLGVGGDVHAPDPLLVSQVRALAALAILGPEALGAARLRQGTDGGEPVVLQQDVDDLDVLLDHGGQLHGEHLVGAVAHDRHDLGLGASQLAAQAGRDLVAHAGEGVLHVVLHRGAGLPQGLKVARHGPGGVDDDVLVAEHLVERAKDLGLGRQRAVAQVVALAGASQPRLALTSDLSGVGLVDVVTLQSLGQGDQGLAGVGHHHLGALLGGIEGSDVDVDELHTRVLELRLGGRGEVGVARTDTDDQVSLVGDVVTGVASGRAHATDGAGVVEVDGTLAGLGVSHRDPGRRGEGTQLLAGLRVDRAAAGDDHRALGGLDLGHRTGQGSGLGEGTAHVPHALAEELDRPVEGLGLDVLRHGDDDGAGLSGVGQHTHGGQQRGNELLGAVDAVKEAGDRAEGVVDGQVQRGGVLQLLEHRVGHAGGELVGGEDEDRHAVGGGQGGAGDHVERARADGGRDHVGRQAVAHLGEGSCRVHSALLIAGHDVGHRVLARGGVDLVL
ncbi:MAG: hypothetical protein Q605_AUC00764G0006 [Actinomyces urogenitalis DORA_12]|uniref:Uncharacterized protein n=1 Tax=Actinomyces urogenitalis DORA_12 TaxID=1403939 RepID=W1VE40_9ACTO|nr:MAG: hypothetical protein Q605_AUC00764G0006 [Actinomyces urogenitalis DORA_12]